MTQLYLISPPKFAFRDFRTSLEAALHINCSPLGGSEKLIGAFQLRLKEADDAEVKAAIRELLPICRAHGVAFIINDRPDLCAEYALDGVHIGQEDLTHFKFLPFTGRSLTSPPTCGGDGGEAVLLSAASPLYPPVNGGDSDSLPPAGEGGAIVRVRSLIGDDAVLGITCHASRHLAMEAGEQGADYVAFGAFYPTASKPKEKLEKWGTPTPEIIEWWTTHADLPCVAIGGINPKNCLPLIRAGADFIAVITAVWQHEGGPAAAIREFQQVMA